MVPCHMFDLLLLDQKSALRVLPWKMEEEECESCGDEDGCKVALLFLLNSLLLLDHSFV